MLRMFQESTLLCTNMDEEPIDPEAHFIFLGIFVSLLMFISLVFLGYDVELSSSLTTKIDDTVGWAFYSSCCFIILLCVVPGFIVTLSSMKLAQGWIDEQNVLIAYQKKAREKALDLRKRIERENLNKNTKLRNLRKSKLRDIAESVFHQNIHNFEIDLNEGKLTFSVNGRRLYYEKSLTKTYKSIRAEMEEDKKNRPPPENDYSIPRCSMCGVRPVEARVSGIRYRHGDVCMWCGDDEC